MPTLWPRVAVLLGFAFSACGDSPKAPGPPPAIATQTAGWYRGDLHYHTNYSEDALRQGGDDLTTALAIADAYRDPAYLAIHPEHAGDGLDFIAITDHRTDAALADPAFRHPHLAVIPGEEYGGSGHANIFGLRRHIPHDVRQGETQDARHIANMAEAHAQGAIFSVNHSTQENLWNWSLDDIDAVEVWNSAWSAFWGEGTLARLDARVRESGGAENPYIRDAISQRGGGPNAQALRLYYNLLTRGRHVAVVGGSDRHMIFPAALPTTYVQVTPAGARLTASEVVAGIRSRATFVSRSPHGAQLTLEARDASGRKFGVGAALPMAARYTISVRVARAKGGLLRLVGGPVLPGTGPASAQPSVLLERPIDRDVFEASVEWNVPTTGGWLHGIALEPRVVEPLDPDFEPLREQFSRLSMGDNLVASVAPLLPIADIDVVLDASLCTRERWAREKAPCMLADQTTGGTLYLPDAIVRLIHTYFEGGVATPYSMGALTSAFLAKP